MAYGIVHFFPGGTKEQYEATLAAAHVGRNQLSEGELLHVAGPSDGGWRVVLVYDSPESWARFRDSRLVPTIEQGIPNGFADPPQETTFDVYHKLP